MLVEELGDREDLDLLVVATRQVRVVDPGGRRLQAHRRGRLVEGSGAGRRYPARQRDNRASGGGARLDPAPCRVDRARFERQRRELAMGHVCGGISDATYLARLGELRDQLAAVDGGSNLGVPADRAVAWLRSLGETWDRADVQEAKADLLHAIYERIVVASPTFVSARLTPAAYAHGLALALPQVVMARPTGVGRAIRAAFCVLAEAPPLQARAFELIGMSPVSIWTERRSRDEPI